MRARARAIHRPGVMNKTEAAYGFYLSDLQNKGDIREDISYCFTREILEKACVTYDLLKSYAPNYVWEFSSPVSLPSPVPLSAIGMTRPPQSWQYLTDEQAAILERRLA